MPPLSQARIDALLAGPVTARLATVKPDGAPYVVPVWQYWDGTSMFIIPREKSRFVDHLRRDPRVAVSCADDVDPAHPRVLLEGSVEIVAGPKRCRAACWRSPPRWRSATAARRASPTCAARSTSPATC